MPKEEWGTKRLCPTTGKRFYDLNASPIISPYTGEEVVVETGKTRTMQADAADAQNKAKAAEADEDELVLDDEEEDVDADLGDDVLEDDDDDDDVPLDEIADVAAPDDDSGPGEGDMACGEFGFGRMSEPLDIVAAIEAALRDGPLKGKHILVTSGPTHEPIDPVRYIANRSSGAQGTAIARALLGLGARVTFVSGPADVPPPMGVDLVQVQTAEEMLKAVENAKDVDAGVFAAAVADWRMANASDQKIKKDGKGLPVLEFAENPDILATICASSARPALVVGFAAETQNVIENATAKRKRKGCDWIVANDVSPATGIMGGTENAVTLITADGAEDWPRMSKDQVADRLALRIAEALNG